MGQGRTKRRRVNRAKWRREANLDSDADMIGLNRFVSGNGFVNAAGLRLRNFEKTGRGVFSKRPLSKGDVLISVPIEVMITFASFKQLSNTCCKLKIHDFLALFLLIERHKKADSFWASYIQALPALVPFLPLRLTTDQIGALEPMELQKMALRAKEQFEESWVRAQTFLNGVKCEICGRNCLDCCATEEAYIWGYTLVNTRAVYVDPTIIESLSDPNLTGLLLDEPSMGLCPFLDLINHTYSAQTGAYLVEKPKDCWKYQVKTFESYKRFEQVYISYGSHDNLKLLTEYGFFIPGNLFDTVKFTITDVLSVLTLKIDQVIWKFLKDHGLFSNLSLNHVGEPSFNLKAVLFASVSTNLKDFASTVYSDGYSAVIRLVFAENCKKLAEFRLKKLHQVGKPQNYFPDFYYEYFNYEMKWLSQLVEKNN